MSEPPSASATRPAGGTDQHLRGSTLMLVGRLLSLLLNMASQVVVVRYLSKSDYGAFAYAVSVISFVQLAASLGQERSVSRFLALYEEQGRPDRVLGTLAVYAGTVIATAALLAPIAVAVAGTVTDSLGEPDARAVLLVLLALAPLDALDKLLESTFAVFTRARAIFVRKYVMQPLVKLAVIGVLVATGGSVVFLAVGHVVAGLLGLALYATQLPAVLRRRGLLDGERKIDLPVRTILGFSIPLLTSELVYLSMNTVSIVLLGWLRDAEAVASYRAIHPAARLNQLVLFSFAVLFTPLAARHFARDEGEELRHTYWKTAAWLTVLSFPVLALTVPLAEPTAVLLLGDRYASSAPYLAILSIGFFVNAAFGYNQQTLQIYGRVRWVVGVNAVAAVLNVVLCLALIPPLGAAGVAVAGAATLVAQNAGNHLGLRRHTPVGAIDRRYLPVYGTVVLAAAALGLVQWLVDPPTVAIVGAAAGTALLVLRATRERIDLVTTFPEITSIPVLRRFLG